jgi:hypothetical protein
LFQKSKSKKAANLSQNPTVKPQKNNLSLTMFGVISIDPSLKNSNRFNHISQSILHFFQLTKATHSSQNRLFYSIFAVLQNTKDRKEY